MRAQTPLFRVGCATVIAALFGAQTGAPTAFAQAQGPEIIVPRGDQRPVTDPPERVGRVAAVIGKLSFHTPDDDQWTEAGLNYPVASGYGYWVEPGGTAQLDVAASRVALDGGSELQVTALDRTGFQAVLPQGEAYLHVRDPRPEETWSLQTPRGLVRFNGPGRYGVVAGDASTPTLVTVVEGSANLIGPGLSQPLGPGQSAIITGQDSFSAALVPAAPDPFLARMMEADTGPAPPPPAVAQMPGARTLSEYGSWGETPDHGPVWYPRVDPGWVPYQNGHWAYVRPWGWTWVDDAPWGFAPFHYGRWAEFDRRWGWIPGVDLDVGWPVYAPALVTFLGVGAAVAVGYAYAYRPIGWCPLGPREVYRPWYRASSRYVAAVNGYPHDRYPGHAHAPPFGQYRNHSAATFVPANVMAASHPIRPMAQRGSPNLMASAQPMAGSPPLRPTAATAGMTPHLARLMNLPPAPPGVTATPRPAAAGPSITPRGAGFGSQAPQAAGIAPWARNPGALAMPSVAKPPMAQPTPFPAAPGGGAATPVRPPTVVTAPSQPYTPPMPQVQRPSPYAAPPVAHNGNGTAPDRYWSPHSPRPQPAPAPVAPRSFEPRPTAPSFQAPPQLQRPPTTAHTFEPRHAPASQPPPQVMRPQASMQPPPQAMRPPAPMQPPPQMARPASPPPPQMHSSPPPQASAPSRPPPSTDSRRRPGQG